MTQEELAEQDVDDVLWVASTEQGRRFLWRVLSQCGVYRDFESRGEDVFKQIGKRQIGLFLIGILSDASEEITMKMMKEANARATQQRIENDNANKHRTNTEFSTLDELLGTGSSEYSGLPKFSDNSGGSANF